jgi:glucose-6-phosphate isomerase
MFRGEKINVTEQRAVLHIASARSEGPKHRRGRPGCSASGACRPRQDGRLL